MSSNCPIADAGIYCNITVVHGSALEYMMNGTLTSVNNAFCYSLPLFLGECVIFGTLIAILVD